MAKRVKPERAIAAKQELKRSRRLKAEFDAVHQQGMDALKARDFSAVGKAIQAEARILDAHQQVVATHIAHAKAVVTGSLNASRRIVKKR